MAYRDVARPRKPSPPGAREQGAGSNQLRCEKKAKPGPFPGQSLPPLPAGIPVASGQDPFRNYIV